MTLNEYINQKEPVRMPVVYLNKGEYKKAGTTTDIMGNKKTRVFINFPVGSFDGIRNEYILRGDSGVLYTIDSDGNVKNRSCFKLHPIK